MTPRDPTAPPTCGLPAEPLAEVRRDLAHQLPATWVVTRR